MINNEVSIEDKWKWEATHKKSLLDHIRYVQTAAALLGVEPGQYLAHDASKWSEVEFPAYARQHQGDRGDALGYAYAWLNHIHNNPHHWNYWVFPDGYHVEGVTQRGALPMPERYVREMIADWHGAGRAYQGHWDISEWLNRSESRMILHSETERLIFRIMEEAGYRGLQSAGLGWEVGDNWIFKGID